MDNHHLPHSRNNPNRSSSASTKKHPHTNNVNGGFTSAKTANAATTYDDVFGGPPRFGAPSLSPRLEDYCEIFSGFNGSSRAAVSSIPVLDLPLVDGKGVCFDVRRESFDYREVFGGFNDLDLAPSYEELFVQQRRSSTVADGDSSDDAWTPEEEEVESVSGKSPSFSNGRDSYDSIDGCTEFNISYHKASSQVNETSVSSGVLRVAAPDVVYTVAVDEMVGASGRAKETGPSSSSVAVAFEDKNGGHQKYDYYPSEPFVTVSEIGLKTHPTGIPPPSRPPPVLKSDFRRSSSNSRSTGSEGSGSPRFFDVEVDASSAAVREAMVKAEAKLKSAKELFERKSSHAARRKPPRDEHGSKPLSSQGSVNSDGNEEWEEATQFVELVRTEQPRNADENSGGEDAPFPLSAGFFDKEKQQRSRAKGGKELPKHPGTRKVASGHKRREDRLAAEKAPEEPNNEELRDVELQFENGNNLFDHGGIVKHRNLLRPEEKLAKKDQQSDRRPDRKAAGKNQDTVFDWEQNARKLREALGLSDNESTLEVSVGTRGEMDESETKLEEALRRMEEETSFKEASAKEETDRKEKEAFEKAENEKRLRAALEQEEKVKKLKEENERREAQKKAEEEERKRKEQEEIERRLKEAFEKEEENRRMREAREKAEEERRRKEQEEYERRLKEAFEKEEKNRRMREAREKAENERKMKEAREKEENERRRIKEAHEKAEVERRMKEEKERQIKEREAYERRAKEALEQAENERKLKEENERKLKEAIELEEKEKRLIEAFERAETERRLKEELEQEEMRLQEAKEKEERENQERQEKERKQHKCTREERDEGDTCEREKTCETTNEANGEQWSKENLSDTAQEDERVDNHEPVEEEAEGSSQRVSVSEEACHWKVFEKNLKDASPKDGTNELDDESGKLNGESSEESVSATDNVQEGKPNHQKSKTVEERSEDEKVKNGSVGGDQRSQEESKCANKTSSGIRNHEDAKSERPLPSRVFMQQREKEAERLKRELDSKMEHLRKIEEEREREREREKDRMAFDQRALADARERLEKACAEARERSFPDIKASTEARLRAERAAVERATAEARERAAEKAAFEARDRMERSVSDKQFQSSGLFGERMERSVSEKQFQNSASFGASRYQNSPGADGESPQRYTSRLERHRRTADRVAKALAEKNMRDLVAQREQAERVRIAETLDAEVKRWSSGKEGNIRALLSTLQYILGSESGWQPLPLTEVITSAAVKRAYRKATLCVHPDKLQQRGANIHQKYICEKVFDLLKEAWNRFNSEER